MVLGLIPMICFLVLSDFWRKTKKEQRLESRHFGPLHHNEGHPRHDKALRRSDGCLPKGQKGSPNLGPVISANSLNVMCVIL